MGTHSGEAFVTPISPDTGKHSERVDDQLWYDFVEEEGSQT